MKNRNVFIIYTLLTFLIMCINFYIFYNKNIDVKKNIVEQEAHSITSLMLALRESYQGVFVKNHIKIDDQTIEFLPIKRTPDIARRFAKILNQTTTVRTISDRPRNLNNKANKEELEIIAFFKDNPDVKSYYKENGTLFTYAEPLYIQKSCLKCHGKKETVIPSIRKKYNTAYDYKLGELRGIITIKTNKNIIARELDANFYRMLISTSILFLTLVFVGYFLIKVIIKNEKNFTKELERKVVEKTIELNNLNHKLKVENENSISLNEELSQSIEELVVVKENLVQRNIQIKENENKITTLINTFSDGLYISDVDYNITYINKPLQKKLGENVVGEKCYKTLYNLDKKCPWCIFEELKTKKRIEYEHDINGKFFLKKNILLDENSKLTIYENITERKKIENALKESEEKYKSIFQSSFAGISILAADGTHIDTNPNCEAIHGYTRDELIGQKFREFSHPDDIEISQNAVKTLLIEGKTKVEIEVRLFHKNTNKIIWIHAMITKYTQAKNIEDSKLLIVFHDITKQKEIEETLLESEEKFSKITNSANDAVILIDNNEKIALWNNTAHKIFGYTKEEIIGKNLHEILPPKKFRETAHKAFAFFRKTGKGNAINKTVELVGLRKNGELFPLELSLSAIKIKGVWNAVGIVRDISVKKEYEAALLESRKRIELSHKDITDNINYAKTIQKALLTSDEKIKQYLSNYFILFMPRDQVSGDFYYVNKYNNYIIFAVADGTGHGVSGGFLTVLGITHLHDIVGNKKTSNPGESLNLFRKKIKDNFKTFGSENNNGFDIALCALNTDTNILSYAGANNPIWIIRNNEIIEYKATKNPIGFYPKEIDFVSTDIQLQKDDIVYLFTDGYTDQFGGGDDKKFTKNQFKKLLLTNAHLPMEEQKKILVDTINLWRGNSEQTDDITVMGVRV